MSLRQELQTIYDDHGRLTPAIVVDVARDEGHPFHSRFEWDDAIAGEAWRLEQAAEIIRSVRVVYRKPDTDERLDVRAFHAIASPEGHSYEPLKVVISDPLLLQLVLRDMEREWRALKARYSNFKEFVEMVKGDLEAIA